MIFSKFSASLQCCGVKLTGKTKSLLFKVFWRHDESGGVMKILTLQFLLPTQSTLDLTSEKLSSSSGSSSSSTSLLSSSPSFWQPDIWESQTSLTWFSMLSRTPTFPFLTKTGTLIMEQLRNTEQDLEQLWQRWTVWWLSTSSSTHFCWVLWSTQVRDINRKQSNIWLFSDEHISSSQCLAGHNRTKRGGGGVLWESSLVLLDCHQHIPGLLSPGASLPPSLQLLRRIIILFCLILMIIY